MSVNGGLAGPKARPKGVADGQQVNIPALSNDRFTDGGTEQVGSGPLRIWVPKASQSV
jgi:hypothetical protein